MTFEELKALDGQCVVQNYSRFPVALSHGKGATLWDVEGKEYIDFTAGIGVNCLGHGNEGWQKAVADQCAKLGHVCNLFYSEPYVLLAQELCRRTGFSRAFFVNSGAEANETLIKLARKYSFDKYGKGRGTILTLNRSFHGRTMATMAATGQEVFHNYFFPFPEGFRYADANDMNSVAEVAGHDVCAILVELIQGEGGVNPLDQEFVHSLRALCDKRDWLLLVDEVQTGVGRTGTFFCYEQYGVRPDAISFAKGIAGGVPFGGVLCGESCYQVFTAGTHGTTFGGNPIAAAAGLEVLRQLDDEVIAQVTEKGNYLRRQIEELNLPCLGKTRGLGLMIGIEVKGEKTNKELATLLIENGLLCLTAGQGLRLLPPLLITKEEMDKGVAIMRQTLSG